MDNPFGLQPRDLQEITALLGKVPAVEQALFFGSRAKGTARRGSDVDIALKGPSLTRNQVLRISMWLNEETNMPYRFDVVDYHALQHVALKEHINRVGVVFYEKAPDVAR